ncbi:MAG: DUF2924 domain-containing protein [Alphaproteobacteria bacterium]|nr:DUF2924 domain-containing protein [Alphaproteobacteria bacterium]
MIEDQVNALKNMNLVELKQLWLDYFKEPAPAYNAIKYYVPRLAYRMQELEYGGVPASLKAEILKAKKPKKEKLAERAKKMGFSIPGTSIVRIYHKQEHVVYLRTRGFEYNGKLYRTLSTIAREITGHRISGRYFFGIKGKKK